jgi:ADP-ribose pyrophosphatase YjhB (NUDIX family)
VAYPRSLTCPHCGYGAYYNPKPVACAIPRDPGGRIILLRRATDPGRDLWTFPGGFVDLGESVEEAAHRETREELDIAITLTGLVGVYSRPDDPIVLVVYGATTTDTPRTTEEACEVAHYDPADLPWSALAFWSTERALRDAVSRGLSARAPSP